MMRWLARGVRRNVLPLAVAVSLSMVSLTGMAQEGTPEPPPIPCAGVLGVGAAGDACVNLIHASPDAPPVDILIDGELAAENLPFGEVTGWVALPAGEHLVQVLPTGQMVDVSVIDATLDLEADLAYEVAATGQIDVIQAAVYPVDLAISEDESNAAVRVIHASSDAPAVDVAATGGDMLVENLSYPDNSAYVTVPAGSYDVVVRPTGATDVVLDVPGVEVVGGNAYSFFAIGSVEEGTLMVLPIVAGAAMAGAEATPAATPAVAPMASPVATPAAAPAASPVATPMG